MRENLLSTGSFPRYLQQLLLGLSRGCRGPDCWVICCHFPKHVSRELDWKRPVSQLLWCSFPCLCLWWCAYKCASLDTVFYSFLVCLSWTFPSNMPVEVCWPLPWPRSCLGCAVCAFLVHFCPLNWPHAGSCIWSATRFRFRTFGMLSADSSLILFLSFTWWNVWGPFGWVFNILRR